MRLIRLWKHLHLLKRGGIGMLPGGVGAADLGSCAVQCPACPRELPHLDENDDAYEALVSNFAASASADDEPPKDPTQGGEPDTNEGGEDEEDEMPLLIPWDEDEE